MKRTPLLMCMIATWGAGIATANECKGMRFADQVQVDGTTLTLNGVGLHQATMFNVDAYVAALYVPTKSSDPKSILESNSSYVMTLQLPRNVGAGDISKGWKEGFEKNVKGQLSTLKTRIDMLNGWMADMKKGQRLTFSFKPGVGLEVNVKGTVKGTIEGDDFSKAFLAISLGASPPDPDLKAGLLGGACR